MIENWKAKVIGLYAIRLYLPLSTLSKRLRDFSRMLRGKTNKHSQATQLPQIDWSTVFQLRRIRLAEAAKINGNVRLSELGLLAVAAANVRPGTEIIEIGTFDGRTTLNLAINAPSDCRVFTLDLPPQHPSKFELDPGELHFVEKTAPGRRYKNCSRNWTSYASRITQLLGDSATFDWTPYFEKAGFVFVDGSHTYEYALADSLTAFKLLSREAVIMWHDYGVWDGVTRALEELEVKHSLGLRHLKGTSFVWWRAKRNIPNFT